VLVATNNFLVPNATFVVELVAFLLVLAVLARYVLPVINKSVEERQATIRQSLVDAETATRRAKEAEDAYRQTLEEARQEARSRVDEANKLGEQLRAELRQRGEQEYERIVARAQADIDASARRAGEELRQQVAGVVMTVVERVISEGFDSADHRALIDRTISQVETEAAAAPEVNA
jgi:F-type H+-transporting ATPase subunit b